MHIRGEGTTAAVCRYIHAVHLPNHCVLRVEVTAVWSAAYVVRTLCWRPVTEKQHYIQHQYIDNKLLKIFLSLFSIGLSSTKLLKKVEKNNTSLQDDIIHSLNIHYREVILSGGILYGHECFTTRIFRELYPETWRTKTMMYFSIRHS